MVSVIEEASASTREGTSGPALALIVLAPLIAEVLSGATRISYIFVLIPEMMVWGCGALLIRETVRRWRAGWPSLLLMGLGLAVAEEFLIQQIAGTAALGRSAGKLGTSVGRELDLLPVHAGLRKYLGGAGSDSGDGTDLPSAP